MPTEVRDMNSITTVFTHKAGFLGLAPFIPGETAKLIAASWIYLKIRPRVNEII
jgi:biotin transporter BioY